MSSSTIQPWSIGKKGILSTTLTEMSQTIMLLTCAGLRSRNRLPTEIIRDPKPQFHKSHLPFPMRSGLVFQMMLSYPTWVVSSVVNAVETIAVIIRTHHCLEKMGTAFLR